MPPEKARLNKKQDAGQPVQTLAAMGFCATFARLPRSVLDGGQGAFS